MPGLIPQTPKVISTAFRDIWDMAFQITPIFFSGGIASQVPGGLLPIATFTAPGVLYSFLTTGNYSLDAFPKFVMIPGSTIVNFTVGNYPFANQQVAANAMIQQPRSVSMRLIAPVNQPGGYAIKLGFWEVLSEVITAHNNQGGSFLVLTPAKVYPGMLLTLITDITSGEGNQPQIEWQFDFVQPIISVQSAIAAMNNLTKKISSGLKLSPSNLSGLGSTVGGVVPGGGTGLPPSFSGFASNFG